MKVLFIDACVREDSRTRMLAEHLTARIKEKNSCDFSVRRIILDEESISSLSGKGLKARNEAVLSADYSAEIYDHAKDLLEADCLVIAAPYWDLSFPSALKVFFENVTVDGLTFTYTDEGLPKGLCKAEKLFFVTTAGGPVISDEYGFGYVRDLAKLYYGIPQSVQFKAEFLDVAGADVESILEKAKADIDAYFA